MKRRMKSFLEGLEYQQESPGQMREELSHTFLKGNVLKGARASELRDRQESISGMFFSHPLSLVPQSVRGHTLMLFPLLWYQLRFSGTSCLSDWHRESILY